MATMYVISKETGLIVATISCNTNEEAQEVFMNEFGPNDFENSYTDSDTEYDALFVELFA